MNRAPPEPCRRCQRAPIFRGAIRCPVRACKRFRHASSDQSPACAAQKPALPASTINGGSIDGGGDKMLLHNNFRGLPIVLGGTGLVVPQSRGGAVELSVGKTILLNKVS